MVSYFGIQKDAGESDSGALDRRLSHDCKKDHGDVAILRHCAECCGTDRTVGESEGPGRVPPLCRGLGG